MSKFRNILVVGALALASIVGVAAVPAGAAKPQAENPPTAIALAKKLVKAGVCRDARLTNPSETLGTAAACTIGKKGKIAVHAFRTLKAMRASLTTDLETDCSVGFGTEFQPKYRVGRYWWMYGIAEPYIADQYPNKPPIGKVLGGQLQTYDLVNVCAFLETIRDRGILTAGTVQIAEDFCREADASSVRTALDTVLGTDYGIDPKDVIFIIGAGITTFCPQHTEAAINAYGPDTPSPDTPSP